MRLLDLIEAVLERKLALAGARRVRDGGSVEFTFSDGTIVWLDHGVRSTTKGCFYGSWSDLGTPAKRLTPTEDQARLIREWRERKD